MGRYVAETNVETDPSVLPIQAGEGVGGAKRVRRTTATKGNLSAAAAPAVTDDGTKGYTVGSRWIDTVGQQEYVCISPATGAAVWKQTT